MYPNPSCNGPQARLLGHDHNHVATCIDEKRATRVQKHAGLFHPSRSYLTWFQGAILNRTGSIFITPHVHFVTYLTINV
ncbi:MAG: hypothetical protein ACI8V2_003707 [Candidatus Latescibacterota bacterium]|jgi:hypothetical protein